MKNHEGEEWANKRDELLLLHDNFKQCRVFMRTLSSNQQNSTSSPWQDLPAWQWVMWLSTFFMVRQWGRLHCRTSPLACSLRWHLCAWSKRTSCCWINLRFSGSAVGGAAPGPAPTAPSPTCAPPAAAAPLRGTPPTAPGCCCWEAFEIRRSINLYLNECWEDGNDKICHPFAR